MECYIPLPDNAVYGNNDRDPKAASKATPCSECFAKQAVWERPQLLAVGAEMETLLPDTVIIRLQAHDAGGA
jgi:hypothetical protein